MFEHGVDGNGSNPLAEIANENFVLPIRKSIDCIHKIRGIDQRYPEANFSPPWLSVNGAIRSIKSLEEESDLLIDFTSTAEENAEDIFLPHDALSDLLKILHLTDDLMYHQDYSFWDTCWTEIDRPTFFYLCLVGEGAIFLNPILDCLGLPPVPVALGKKLKKKTNFRKLIWEMNFWKVYIKMK
eukprot:Trichotokara_eunicae@DN4188_c0_g1_i1.p1